jgi:hypothetical protein
MCERQSFAELYIPLIECINLSDNGPGGDSMVIESDKLAERTPRGLIREDDVQRPIALEDSTRRQPVRNAPGVDLDGRPPQGPTLREDVCYEHVMVAPIFNERLHSSQHFPPATD